MRDDNEAIKLFSTAPHPCSYLEGQEASTLFLDPAVTIDQATYSYLCELGYRRSGNFVYKPNCANCDACISVRLPVNDYLFSRSEKRILKKNHDLRVEKAEHIFTTDCYKLYASYICQRHIDGDMYPPSLEQYKNFLNNGFGNSEYYCFYLEDSLKAVAVVDRVDHGLSAVYTFYDPFDNKRSLGNFAVLWQIQAARMACLDYVYLGYWVKNCHKMSYKSRYRPMEMLINEQWLRVNR
jgi:arginine-tRNA-protein transferase